MAFSTQREVLNFPFRDEEPSLPDRKRSDCQLKSYESCTDVRAWSMNPKVTAKYLLDVVHKSRRKLPRPRSSDGLLIKAYLQQLDVDELADYVMDLIVELEEVKSKVRILEVHQKSGDIQVAEINSTYEPDKEEEWLIANLRTITFYKILLITLIGMFMILTVLTLVRIGCSN